MSAKKKMTKAEKRLLSFFKDVEDDSLRDIMIDVLTIERSNRSAKRFPINKIRDIVDSNARLIEKKGEA